MIKYIFLLIFPVCLFSQEYGLTQGLSVKVPYGQYSEEDAAVRNSYNNFKQNYFNAVQNNYNRSNPIIQPADGWYKAKMLQTNVYVGSYVENGSVYIENGIATKFQENSGKTLSIFSGGSFSNFRAVVTLGGTKTYEIILLMILQ